MASVTKAKASSLVCFDAVETGDATEEVGDRPSQRPSAAGARRGDSVFKLFLVAQCEFVLALGVICSSIV